MARDPADTAFEAIRAACPITASRAYLFAGGMAPLCEPARRELTAYADLCASDPVAAYREYPRRESGLLRELVARTIGARASEVAILDSTSRGNNLAVQMLDAPPGANVVVDATTYPSALAPWLLPVRAHVEVRVVPEERGIPSVEQLERLVDERTIAVSVSHVCRLTGFRHDLGRLAEIAHAHDARLLVDAAQSVGALAVDVERDGVDAMAFGAMKWLLGTPGLAFLYVRESLAERLPPPQVGPAGTRVAGGRLEYEPGARRHELSSWHWGGLAATRCAAELVTRPGAADVERRVLDLSGRTIDGLRARGLDVLTPADPARRAGVVAFRHARPDALRAHLRAFGVDVWGWEGEGLMRADPHVYNTDADVDRLLAGIDAFV